MNESNESLELHGTVERVLYTNPTNGYLVFVLQQPNKEPITVQGIIPAVHEGQLVTIRGSWKIHPKFGKQFNAQQSITHAPTSIAGLKKYLASGLIKGIGPSYAERLVDFFGTQVLEIIDKNPEQVARVPGIGKKRLESIIAGWQEQKEISHIMLFLSQAGVSTAYATKIYKKYGSRTIELMQENPYRLAQEVWGIGFRLADQLAKALGFAPDGEKRLSAGILFALTTQAGNGHLYVTLEKLIASTIELLELTHENRDAEIRQLISQLLLSEKIKHIEHDGESFIALSSHYASEKGCASRLLAIKNHKSVLPTLDFQKIYQELRIAQGSLELHEEQQKAVLSALQNKVTIITGGPGTGKTTIIKSLINLCDRCKISYQLAAPTGRAAKRMMQATARPAMTIHRLLEFDPSIMKFTRDEKNALPAQCIIIDEASMIDIFLAHALLKAIPLNAHLVFIGDVDQLPSVGPGNFLRDMLTSKIIPSMRLTHIFRQAQDSLIVMNAHRINQGEFPVLSLPSCKRDFLFIKEDLPENIPTHLTKIYNNYLPSCGINADDAIVLVPMNRGTAGTQKLNHDLQTIINSTPHVASLNHAGTSYKIGDQVMQLRNNYDKLVFNGDIGVIKEINQETKAISVLFIERVVVYESDDLDELTLAYAISIHKSQGSEYPAVIVPLFMQHFTLLARNLVYTALTRAKKLCIFVGQTKALAIALRNNTSHERVTFLALFLKEEL